MEKGDIPCSFDTRQIVKIQLEHRGVTVFDL